MLGGEPDAGSLDRDNAWLLSKWHVDLYTRRGVGLGLDLIDTRIKNANLSGLKLYHIYDLDPNLQRSNTPRSGVDPHRFQALLQYRKDLNLFPDGDSYVDINLDIHSDRFFLEDYLPNSFRVNPQPDNTVSFIHQQGYHHFTAMVRAQPNPFYQSDVRYPELSWDRIRAPIWGKNLLYETQNSIGIIREFLADFEEDQLQSTLSSLPIGDPQIPLIQDQLDEPGFVRAHSWHEFSYPTQYGDWLNLVPRAGLGFTSYKDVFGNQSTHHRFVSFAGWGINEFLHVVQPYLSFSHITSDDNPENLNPIDRLTPTTRPPPIHLGRYTALDEIFDSTILRLGVHNRLLTKRNGGTHQWLTLNTYLDVFMDDPQFERGFSNLYNDLVWHPLPWVNLSLETQLPIIEGGAGFSEIVTRATFMPHENWEFTIGHRHLDSHPLLNDSNRVDLRVYNRLNENWGVGLYNRWELDQGILELQQYSLHHNTESWVISGGIFHRNNVGKDDWGGVLSFTLKALPSINLPLRVDAE